MIKVKSARGTWREPQGFELKRNAGNEYVFIHVCTPCYIDGVKKDKRTIIIYGKNEWRHLYSPDCELVHDWMHMTGDVEKVLKKYGIELNKSITLPYSSFISEIVQTIEIEFLQQRSAYEEIISSLIEQLFIKIKRAMTEIKINSDSAYYKDLVQLRNKVMSEYQKDWTVEKMAEMLSFSVSKFYQTYNAIFGVSPQKDLQNTRIEHAKHFLLQGTYTVNEISEMVGYKSNFHFIRQFGRVCGISPGKFAKHE